MRIAEIKQADFVDGSDKLLKLILDLGEKHAKYSPAFSSAYPDPKVLEGQQLLWLQT